MEWRALPWVRCRQHRRPEAIPSDKTAPAIPEAARSAMLCRISCGPLSTMCASHRKSQQYRTPVPGKFPHFEIPLFRCRPVHILPSAHGSFHFPCASAAPVHKGAAPGRSRRPHTGYPSPPRWIPSGKILQYR